MQWYTSGNCMHIYSKQNLTFIYSDITCICITLYKYILIFKINAGHTWPWTIVILLQNRFICAIFLIQFILLPTHKKKKKFLRHFNSKKLFLSHVYYWPEHWNLWLDLTNNCSYLQKCCITLVFICWYVVSDRWASAH